jgi:hypothetical protein
MITTRLHRIYFETSALNALQEQMSWEVALNTRAYQNLKGRGFYISQMVIFEILSTKDEGRREELIFFAQHLFEPILLPSPEELIITFVEAGCPKYETDRELKSAGNMAKHWQGICQDRRKTLLFDAKAVKSISDALRTIGQLIFDFHSHQTLQVPKRDELVGVNLSVCNILTQYDLVPKEHAHDSRTWNHYGLVTLLIITIFCSGITVDQEPIEAFWKRRGIIDLETRISYTFNHFPQLVSYGPFHLLALVIDAHSDKGYSRGMLFDCLHSLYAFYSDGFLTSDDHFRGMRERLPADSPIRSKIHHLDEVEINWVETSDAPEPKGWLDN